MAEPDELHPLAQAAIDAHTQLGPAMAEQKRAHVEGLLHQLEADLAPLIGPLVQQILDNPAASDELRQLMAEAGTPQHQFGSIVVGFAIGATVGPALGAVLEPELEGIRKVAWAQNPSRVIPADVAASTVLKGVLDQPTAAGIAAFSGYNATQFDHLVQAAGQSIGIEQALLLWRRGQITDAHLADIVKYSNINPKFYGDVPKLKYVPPSPSESIVGALKHHLDPAVARTNVGHAGIDPANFDWMLASAGRPLGLEEMLHLLNRGVMTEAQVRQGIAQSDINDDYTDFALQLRHYFPPPRSIVPMLRAGGITEAQARELLTFYGVGEPWASAFIAEAHHTSSTTVKELTQAQVVRMYSTRLIDRPTANARLLAAKYPQGDVTLLLDFADNARHERVWEATINKVGSLYVAHKIGVNEATTLLGQAQVPVAAQHDLFTLWDIQRTANVHVPTAAGIVGAARRQELTPAETKLRLNQLGIADGDLAIFVADGWPPTHALEGQAAAHAVVTNQAVWPPILTGGAPAPKRLTVVQISQLYSAGTIGKAEAISDLQTLGYTLATATQLVSTFPPHNPPIP